jgi:hypothetical protein
MDGAATGIGRAFVAVVALRRDVAPDTSPASIADLTTILIASAVGGQVAAAVAVACGRVAGSIDGALVVVVAGDRSAEIAKPIVTLAHVTVRAAHSPIGRTEVATETTGRVALIRDAVASILAGIWGAKIGVDTASILTNAEAPEEVARPSDVRHQAASAVADCSGAHVAVVLALRAPVALDALAELVAEAKGALPAWCIDDFGNSAFTCARPRVASTVAGAVVLVFATHACAKTHASATARGATIAAGA